MLRGGILMVNGVGFDELGGRVAAARPAVRLASTTTVPSSRTALVSVSIPALNPRTSLVTDV